MRDEKTPYLALEFLGHIAGGGRDLFGIGVTLSNKDEQVILDLTAKDLLGALVVELDDQRQSLGLDELDDGFRSDVALEGSLGIVEFLEKDNTGVRHFVLLEHLGGRADTETEVVNLLGSRHELLGSLGFQVLNVTELKISPDFVGTIR